MEPILCPNGHPNRPGTRICAVCRALIPPPPAPPVVAGRAQPEPPPPARLPVSGGRVGAGGWLLAALLLLLLAAVVIMAAYVFLYPARRSADYLATAAVVTLPAGASTTAALPAAAVPSAQPSTPAPVTSPTPISATAPARSPTAVATITPLANVTGLALSPAAAAASESIPAGLNLIQNGDFAADWANGWERQADGSNGSAIVEGRVLAGDPPLPSLHLGQWGTGSLRVVQHVSLTGAAADLVFRGRVRLAGLGDPVGGAGRAALILLYEDADGRPLGASVWLDGGAGEAATSLLSDGSLPPLGLAAAPRLLEAGWQSIELPIGREFAERLPGLAPDAVRRITIVLAVAGSAGCRPDACPAELDAAGLSLVAAPGG